MKFLGIRRKSTIPEEERMHYSASSFSFAMGDVFPCRDAEDVSLLMKARQGYIVILYPGDNLVKEPRSWVKALSNASYLIVVANEKNKVLKQFLSLLDSQIFSPLPKTLSGSICLEKSDDIKALTERLLAEGKHCLTIIPR